MVEAKPAFELLGPPTRGIKDKFLKGMVILTLNRVCSTGTAEETEQWIRTNHPAGTTGNWHLAEEDHRKPIKCHDDPKRTHYFFVC